MNEDLEVTRTESKLQAPKRFGVSPRELLKLQKLKRDRDTTTAIQQAGGNILNLKNQLEQEKRRQERVQPLVLKKPSQADLTAQRDRLLRAAEIKKSGSLQNEQRQAEIQKTPKKIDLETIKQRAEELQKFIQDGISFLVYLLKNKKVLNVFQQRKLVMLEVMLQNQYHPHHFQLLMIIIPFKTNNYKLKLQNRHKRFNKLILVQVCVEQRLTFL